MLAGNNLAGICVYIDSDRNLTIVSFYYYEDTPMSVDVGEYKLIDPPYTTEKIGIEILSCYEQARHKPSVTLPVLWQKISETQLMQFILRKWMFIWRISSGLVEVCLKYCPS